MYNWLVSIEKDDKIIDLYYSKNLEEMSTIRAIHQNCIINTMRIYTTNLNNNSKNNTVSYPVKKYGRLKSKRVRCMETSREYSSVIECANIHNVQRINIYQSIQRGITAAGLHFEYID